MQQTNQGRDQHCGEAGQIAARRRISFQGTCEVELLSKYMSIFFCCSSCKCNGVGTKWKQEFYCAESDLNKEPCICGGGKKKLIVRGVKLRVRRSFSNIRIDRNLRREAYQRKTSPKKTIAGSTWYRSRRGSVKRSQEIRKPASISAREISHSESCYLSWRRWSH